MNYKIKIFLVLILLQTGCSKKTDIKKEFEVLNSYSKNLVGHDLEMMSDVELIENGKRISFDEISLGEAVGIALKNSSFLQASFEDLGIAKADLEYAGLYGTNPHLESILKFPENRNSGKKPIWELEGSIPLSKYWQVPLKRRVFKDELLIVTWGIASVILDTIKNTKTSYANCFFLELQIKKYKEIINIANELLRRMEMRKNYGLETDKAIYEAKEHLQKFIIEKNRLTNEFKNQLINLRKAIGINLKGRRFALKTDLKKLSSLSFDRKLLLILMKNNNPDLYLADIMISKYKKVLTLERSKFIKELNLGFSYEREDDGSKVFGPLLSMNLPIFDSNRGEIEKTKFMIRKLKKTYLDKKSLIKQELLTNYNNFNYFNDLVKVYESSLIPLRNNIKEFTLKHFKRMQLTKIESLNAKLDFYLTEVEKLKKEKEKFISLVNLERIVGKELVILGESNASN
ncbi:hypothetical protein GF385_01065 [Candidatus Dependentiae bacterium]|nr:hypothetical protein [Candidatus Dependentiae bacterium]